MRSTRQDLFPEPEDGQDVGEDPEDQQIVSLNRLLEKHRDEEVLFHAYLDSFKN